MILRCWDPWGTWGLQKTRSLLSGVFMAEDLTIGLPYTHGLGFRV